MRYGWHETWVGCVNANVRAIAWMRWNNAEWNGFRDWIERVSERTIENGHHVENYDCLYAVGMISIGSAIKAWKCYQTATIAREEQRAQQQRNRAAWTTKLKEQINSEWTTTATQTEHSRMAWKWTARSVHLSVTTFVSIETNRTENTAIDSEKKGERIRVENV